MATSTTAVASRIGPATPDASETCPECGGAVRPHGIERVCANCGLVVGEDTIDRGPDWRTYDDRERDRKHAEPVEQYRQGKHLGSMLGYAGERDGRVQRWARYHERATKPTSQARNSRYVIGEIERIASAVGVPEYVGRDAKAYWSRLRESGSQEGRDLDQLAAACVFAALRMARLGYVAGDVAAVARADEQAIQRRYRWLASELGLDVPPPDIETRVRRVGNDLGLAMDRVDAAVKRVREMDSATVTRGSPSTLAAAVVYEVSDRTQREVADSAGVTPAGMRMRSGKM